MVPSKEEVLTFIDENLSLDDNSGDFLWKNDRAGGKVKAGSVAGSVNKGYRQIRIHSKWFKAHRLVWLFETGDWPKNQIDHKNGDRLDNRFSNLQDVTNFMNCYYRTLRKSSNYVGVSYDKVNSKWLSQTYLHGRLINLGRFSDKEAAREAYLNANKTRLEEETE